MKYALAVIIGAMLPVILYIIVSNQQLENLQCQPSLASKSPQR